MNSQVLDRRSTYISIGIIGTMFFVFGFISWVNAILIPYFKIACELTNFQSYLVAFAFYISYLVMSLPSSYLLKRVGYKRGITIGFWIMAVGALLFVPAAYGRTYLIFLLGLFTLGSGLAVLQTVANLYITMIGEKERAAQRISIMGICNKGAGILAPLAFSWAILRPSDNELFKQIPLMDEVTRAQTLDELILRVVVPYIVVASVLFLIGLFVKYSPLPEIESEEDDKANESKSGVFQFPNLVLGAVAIFLHVGTQVIAIDTIINYAGSMGLSLLEAKALPSYVLTATICGYLLGITLIPALISQKRMLQICSLVGLTLSLLVCLVTYQVDWLGHHLDISIWFLAMIGVPNALIWAGIWPLALDGLGKYAKQGSALLIMGLCGNAVLPMIYGLVADSHDVKTAYWVLVPCFLYIVFYAFIGHRFKSWKKLT
ncbi:glucose/galactose MFS transporter [Sphingobacterium sp. DK4209]|uniref:Glucose/galactose MFS transporter n=1 Tax=Sphingobacterium zhuxiongii TaxID=2662364 RepID=A0A5Q0QB91_9SPHI|nr:MULTISPECIES: sugar MFS transporter [unclassified Sphingobacterium]MVZ66562.1 glucose/galactose MFS transporter [Sphingobacterium sp. DK4209]QGA26746.1 glucose/galactose MFS transporter [Sphingobacterium sp. dk4302]